MNERERSAKMGERLKILRENTFQDGKKLSHVTLRDKLKELYGIEISRDSLMNYEVSDITHSKFGTNLKMRVEYLYCLADFYGVSTDYLLGISNYKSIETERTSPEKLGMNELSAEAQSEFWMRIEDDYQNLKEGIPLNEGGTLSGGLWQFYFPIWNDFLSSRSFLDFLRACGRIVEVNVIRFLVKNAELPFDFKDIRPSSLSDVRIISDEKERNRYLKNHPAISKSYETWKLEQIIIDWIEKCANKIAEEATSKYLNK